MEMGMIRNCNETPFGNGAIGCRGKPSLFNRRREEGPPACPPVCSVPSQQRLSDPLSLPAEVGPRPSLAQGGEPLGPAC